MANSPPLIFPKPTKATQKDEALGWTIVRNININCWSTLHLPVWHWLYFGEPAVESSSFFLPILIEFQQKKNNNRKSIISIWSSRDVGFNSDWLRKKHKIFQPIAKGRGIQNNRYCNSTRARVPLVLFGSIFSYFLYGNRILRHNDVR